MLLSLAHMQEVRKGSKQVLRNERWLQFLYLTKEKRVNLEQVKSLHAIPENPVLEYVEKTLWILNDMDLPIKEKEIIEEVLMWSEVAKGGMNHKRKEWKQKGYQLAVHNIGSAQIYAAEQMKNSLHERDLGKEELIRILILTHGSVGQFIRGEVSYQQFKPLTQWVGEHHDIGLNIHQILFSLNRCVTQAVSESIWKSIEAEALRVVDWITEGESTKDYALKERLRRLRRSSFERGENFEEQYNRYFNDSRCNDVVSHFFKKADMWYVESALQDFTFEEFLKVFLLTYQQVNPLSIQHINFESFMKEIYYDYKGEKAINLYKKRIIESYLRDFSVQELLEGKLPENEHVQLSVTPTSELGEIVDVTFVYSKAGQKLIEFCQEAEKSPLYERAIIMLYDFFGFRKDNFDRLQNEQTYLDDMNNGQDHKKVISDYAVGDMMIDVGAGGGVMLDILSENHPEATVVGIDVSTNVIEELNRRKFKENKNWLVEQADALQLSEDFDPNSVDTIVFSSVLHELYSYIPYQGKRFNKEVIVQALRSSFEVLNKGGRIIIRDGIMTEPKEEMRLLEFLDPNGMDFFKRYVSDFKGRAIQYEQISENIIKLPVNDLMEFCYTYTWGEEAYPHEVQEQFGYFTPTEYRNVIEETLGSQAKIIQFQHYLQDGYEEFLSPKVSVMSEDGKLVPLPDSTCFIVIEKE